MVESINAVTPLEDARRTLAAAYDLSYTKAVAAVTSGLYERIKASTSEADWPRLAPLLLYGGGISPGRVIGQSTRDGGEPDTTPVTLDHLTATIMHTLFDIGQLRLAPGLPTDLLRLMTESEPIRELM